SGESHVNRPELLDSGRIVDIFQSRTIPCARERRVLGEPQHVSRSAGSVFRSFSFFVRCRGDVDAAEGSGGMSDRTLTCRDCGQAFTFTAGEQAFYAERGFSEPQRCPTCRSNRKAQRASSGYDSGYGGGSGGGGGYSSGCGGYSSGGSYSSGGYSSGGGGGYSSGGSGGGG